MPTRLAISILLYGMVNAVAFGTGLITVLSIPVLAANAGSLIPAVIVISFIAAAPISWMLAPRLRARFWRKRETESLAAS